MATVTSLDTAPAPAPAGRFSTSICSFARPTNTTVYAANDVISDDDATAKALIFPVGANSGLIWGVTLGFAETDTVTPQLYLFDSEPTNHADGDALTLAAADVTASLGWWDFVEADKETVGSNLNIYRSANLVTLGTVIAETRKPFATADQNLYGLLVAVSSYTPISANKVTIKLHLERD